jgi:hypothetical protein
LRSDLRHGSIVILVKRETDVLYVVWLLPDDGLLVPVVVLHQLPLLMVRKGG